MEKCLSSNKKLGGYGRSLLNSVDFCSDKNGDNNE
jgi:hypothetical protein